MSGRFAAVCLGLALLVAAVFAQTDRHDFLNFDDADYVLENRAVLAGVTWDGVRWAFTTTHAGNWHPLTWVSHMIDVQFFGLDAGAHHLMSAALHGLTAILILAVFVRMTGALGRSAFVAALFAVHPLHVESVAWVAERKDVLSTLFWALTLLAYTGYVRRPAPPRYALVVVAFAAALLAKPMVVTLPFLLLVLDVWPLGRWARERPARLVIEKLPLVAMAAGASVMTVVAQRGAGAVKTLEAFPFTERVTNAIVSYVAYVWQTMWPANLAAIYPYPASRPAWQIAGALAVLGAVTFLAWRARARRPYLLAGWLWFVGTLVPVIGLVQVGSQPMADRYMYVPVIGLLVMAAWGAVDLLSGRRALLAAAAVTAIAASAVVARRQVAYWHDSVALWEHAVAVTADNYRARTNLGHALAEQARLTEAVPHYLEAIRLNPTYADARNYLGVAYADLGRHADAARQYEEALRLRPRFVEAHNNFGLTLAAQEKLSDAIAQFSEAKRLDPSFAPARNNLAIALASQGQLDAAIQEFKEALALQPDNASSHFNLAVALANQGRIGDAIAELKAVLQIDPTNAAARDALQELTKK